MPASMKRALERIIASAAKEIRPDEKAAEENISRLIMAPAALRRTKLRASHMRACGMAVAGAGNWRERMPIT